MCICCVTCCCMNYPMKTITRLFLIFTSVSFFFSILILCFPAANTGRYDKAKTYLMAIENNEIPVVDPNDLRNLISSETTIVNGKEIRLTRVPIRYSSIYKKWKNTELIVNIINLIIIIPLFVTNILILCIKRDNNGNITDKKLLKRLQNLSMLDLILLIVFIVYCIILSYLRTLVIICDQDIGLYYEDDINSFQWRTSFADSLNLIQLLSSSISISFAYKLYYNAKYYNGRNTNQNNNNNIIAINNMNQGIPVAIVNAQPVNGQYIYGQSVVPIYVVQDPQNMNYNNNNYNNSNRNNTNLRSYRSNSINRRNNQNDIEVSEFQEK